jgi:glycosyltransferase involved in cell wall biosynthesis
MATGLPCVAPDIAGVAEFLTGAGHPVKPGNAQALANAAIDILCRPAEARRSFSTAARQRAEEAFDVTHQLGVVQERYERLLTA